MARRPSTKLVHQYFRAHPGLTVHRSDIAEAQNIPPTSVSSAITRLRLDPNLNGEIVGMGVGKYRFTPYAPRPTTTASQVPAVHVEVTAPKATTVLFEQVTELKSGKLLLQDENGDLYTAEPL